MSLLLESRRVGDMTVVRCTGRIVEGGESAALQQHLESVISVNPRVILHLGGVEFIDSGGLGLLVRFLTRARNGHGLLKVCNVSPKVDEVLRVTRLRSVFHPYETEDEAIADSHRPRSTSDVSFSRTNVLCVDQSPDLCAYLRELLKEAGYHVMTAENLPDALILLRATQPKVVIVGAELRAARGTWSAEEFNRRADARPVIELPRGFSSDDAGEAARRVLDDVREMLKDGTASAM